MTNRRKKVSRATAWARAEWPARDEPVKMPRIVE